MFINGPIPTPEDVRKRIQDLHTLESEIEGLPFQYWDDGLCPICACFVPRDRRVQHGAWHKSIAVAERFNLSALASLLPENPT